MTQYYFDAITIPETNITRYVIMNRTDNSVHSVWYNYNACFKAVRDLNQVKFRQLAA